MKVHLFITCLNDALFPKTGIATTQILERLGHTVEFDPRQTCCGQMHLNSGYRKEAAVLAKQFIEVFKDAECIVSPSGSCVANVREMFINLGKWTEDEALVSDAERLRGRVFELSEFLLTVEKTEDVGAYFPHRVTYHPTCHATRGLGLSDSPLKLLKAVKGIDYVELQDGSQCCGFGGTFSVKNAETSSAMLADKCDAVNALDVEYCVALDNSCLMHIGGGLKKSSKKPKVIHLAEVLASRGER